MTEDNVNYYIQLFTENCDKVKTQTLKDNFHQVDNLSSFFHNLIECINIKWNEEKNRKLNLYFEQIIEESFLEIAKECENFILLLINGFYDGAIKSLRHILENFIIHYYFSVLEKTGNLKTYYVQKAEFYKLSDQLTEEETMKIKKYKEENTLSMGELSIYEADSYFCWKLGKQYLEGYNFVANKPILKDFPKFKDCLDLIFKQENFKDNGSLKEEVLSLYKEFSKILHNRQTISRYKTTSSFLNNYYTKEDLKKSIELYKKVEKTIAIFLLFGNLPNFNKVCFTYIPEYKTFKENLEKTNQQFPLASQQS